MSKLKKMLSLVVAMVMVLAMSIPTFAATGKNGEKAAEGTASDKGTITVSGVEETGVTVKAYQIIKAKYENGILRLSVPKKPAKAVEAKKTIAIEG